MSIVIAFMNQKGGVGKTTSTVSLAAEFAKNGNKVLMIDLDPQCSATSGVGVSPITDSSDLFDVFLGDIPIEKIIKKSGVENLDVVPGSKDLVSLELSLGSRKARELLLKTELSKLNAQYQYILIDCPPSSGLLSLNALGSADYVCVPLQAEYYALEGISSLMETVRFVQNTFNPSLQILGVFLTMTDARTNLSAQVEEESRRFFKQLMFDTKIPRNIRLSESPSHGMPICIYDSQSPGARAYKVLAMELQERLIGSDIALVSGL